jgi:DNA polymerase I-like protein with 3'-5' exonuclease and polymerase domains
VFEDDVMLSHAIIDLHKDVTTPKDAENLDYLRELAEGGALFIFQSLQYDFPRLLKSVGIRITRFRDTKLLSQLAHCGMGSQRHSLNDILKRELGFDPYEEIGRDRIESEAKGHLTHWSDAPERCPFPRVNAQGDTLSEQEACDLWIAQEVSATKKRLQASDWAPAELSNEQWEYAAMDVSEHFYKAWQCLEKKIVTLGMENLADLEHQVLPAVMEMEHNGIKMHMDKWDQLLLDTKKELEETDARIIAVVDVWVQELYPKKFMVTLKRKKPREGTPEVWSAGKPARFHKRSGKCLAEAQPPKLLKPEVPAQLVGDLLARQSTPELFPLLGVSQDLLDLQEGDYRVGAVVWKELGLTTSVDNYEKHQFNISSAKQMRALINDMMGISYKKPDGTNDDALLTFSEPVIKDMIRDVNRKLDESTGAHSLCLAQIKCLLNDHLLAQGLRKLVSTYGESYQKHADDCGYIRSSFQTTATFTGRMSSSDPNIQNIPREWQYELFCCEAGEAVVSCDYSNMEGRTLFYVTGQMDVYNRLTNGMDLHSLSASFICGKPYDTLVERLPGEAKDTIKSEYKKLRQTAKGVTFAPMFGSGPNKISELLDCSYDNARKFLNRYWANYPITKQVLDSQFESAVNNGYITDLSFGRKRFFEMNDDDRAALNFGDDRIKVLGRWKTEAYNYPAQAGGATCLKVALISLFEWIKRHPETKTVLRLCVHDSIKVTCDPAYAPFVGNEIARIMENAAEYALNGARVPVDVDIHYDKAAPRSFTHRNLAVAAA